VVLSAVIFVIKLTVSLFRSVIHVVYLRTKYTNTYRKAVKNTTII